MVSGTERGWGGSVCRQLTVTGGSPHHPFLLVVLRSEPKTLHSEVNDYQKTHSQLCYSEPRS